MSKWKAVKFGDIGIFQTGGTPSRSIPDYFSGSMPWITTTALGSLYVDESKANLYLTESGINHSATKIIPRYSLLFGIRVGVGKASINKVPICTNQDIIAVSNIDTGKISLEYLHRFLSTKRYYFDSQKRGATIQGIKSEHIKELPVPLPPLGVQRKIADVLDRAAALIEKRRTQIEKLDLLVKSRFIEMFGKLKEQKWDLKRLDEIASTRLGKMLDAKRQTGICTYPYLANFNVQWFHFNLERLNEMDFDDADRKEFSLRCGDLLICEGGEVGRTAIWHGEHENCYFQKALHRVRCNPKKCIPEYIAWTMYFKVHSGNFDGIASVATIAHLPGVKLKALMFPVPPLPLQSRFADFVRQVGKVKSTLKKSLAMLERNYNSLMQKCFRGEIF